MSILVLNGINIHTLTTFNIFNFGNRFFQETVLVAQGKSIFVYISESTWTHSHPLGSLASHQ